MAVNVEKIGMRRLGSSSDIFIAVAVISVIVMIIIPLSTFLLSILVTLSLSLALITLMVGMYTTEPLKFSVFPSAIILTTVYRLSLNISTTRSILANANAGEVINLFGSVVVGNNYVVGFVIFLIIMLVNYMVIANGAVRIGEVAARFTLDAMPGKQMAIDADLNAGIIDEEGAKKRRRDLEREADFFGAMDGASRFVQRDALAGIIIVAINIFAGFVIGMVQHKMDWLQALQTYTRLSIGDGLVASIPSLLMSTTTGIMVTNAVTEANLGKELITQYLAHPRAMALGAIILSGFGILLPGMAKIPFFLVAAGFYYIYWIVISSQQVDKAKEIAKEKKLVGVRMPESVFPLLHIDPLELEIGYALIPLVDIEMGGDLLDRVTMIRRQIAIDLGLVVPPIRIRDNMQIKPNEYVIKVKGVEVAHSEIMLGYFLAMAPLEAVEKIEGIETQEPAFKLPAIWITEAQKERAENLGYTVVDCTSVIATHLTEIIRSYSPDILGRQETQELVNNIKQTSPAVVEELIPNILTIGDVQKVLQNLLRERVSVRDIRTILETLADQAKTTKDLDTLTEFVRIALSRFICKQYLTPDGKLVVMSLDPNLEQRLVSSLQQTTQGAFLVLEPELGKKVLDSLAAAAERMASLGYQPIFLTSSAIRLHLRRLLERSLPTIILLSYNEIVTGISVESLGMIRIQ